MIDPLDLISRDTPLKRTSAHGGGEYSGPCPLCRRGAGLCGTDRFKVWPRRERWACLGRKAGRAGCDRGGDAIQYLRERDGLSYREACARLDINAKNLNALNATTQCDRRSPGKDAKKEESFAPSCLCVDDVPSFAPYASSRLCVEAVAPPNALWQARAREWAAACEAHLWQPEGAAALAYLHRRGLGDAVLRAFHVGYNPCDCYEQHSRWGLTPSAGGARRIWVPRGITFPWFGGGAIWRLNVRRPLTPAQIARGEAKYIGPAGFANALYNADALPAAAVILVEGEIDALTIVQAFDAEPGGASGGRVIAVATGSTGGARCEPWLTALAAAPLVLAAFDNDDNDHNDHNNDNGGSGDSGGREEDAPDAPDALGAGDMAAAWWRGRLRNARRWHPLLHDVNTHPGASDVRAWLAPALHNA